MDNVNKLNIPKNLDWELLKRFQVVTNSNTFAEAAIKIGTSQGALVNQMSALENSLKTDLFLRSAKKRSIELTPIGKILASMTNKIDNIFSSTNSDLEDVNLSVDQQDNQVVSKHITIITTPGLSTTFIPDILIKFIQINPSINFRLNIQSSPPVLNVGEVVIRHDFLPQPNLKIYPLISFYHSFYASKKYLDIHGEPKSFNELFYHKMLSFDFFNISNLDKYALDQGSYIYIEPKIQSNFIFFLIEMALRDQGIIELPDFHPAIKKLVHIKTLESTKTDIYVGFLNIHTQDKIINSFIDFVRQEIPKIFTNT